MRIISLLVLAIGGALSAAFALGDGSNSGPQTPPQQKPWDLGTPKPVPDGRISKLEHLGDYACARCHLEVAEEWAATSHATAWVDPIYREEIAGKSRPEACHGCHIPTPIHLGPLGQKPEARADSKDDPWEHGVSCQTCHQGPSGAILGPWGAENASHLSKRSDSMIDGGSSELCLSCHRVNIGPVIGIAKDFETSDQKGRGRSCVGCHWAPVERAWANAPLKDPGSVEASASKLSPRKGRSHATQTPRDPAFLVHAFETSAAVKDGKTVVTIRNATGHRVPGLIGRSFEITASVVDAGGKVLGEKKQVFDTRAHLPVDQSVELAIGAQGKQVHLVGVHHDPRLEQPVTFLDVMLTPAGP